MRCEGTRLRRRFGRKLKGSGRSGGLGNYAGPSYRSTRTLSSAAASCKACRWQSPSRYPLRDHGYAGNCARKQKRAVHRAAASLVHSGWRDIDSLTNV